MSEFSEYKDTFMNMYYPANYNNEQECLNYLYYKYGIKLPQTDYSSCWTGSNSKDVLEKIYQAARNSFPHPLGLTLLHNEEFKKRDIIYLIMKEFLFLYQKENRKAVNSEKQYNVGHFSKKYDFSSDALRKRNNDYKYLNLYKSNDFLEVFSNEQLDCIIYNIIWLSNDNPYILYREKRTYQNPIDSLTSKIKEKSSVNSIQEHTDFLKPDTNISYDPDLFFVTNDIVFQKKYINRYFKKIITTWESISEISSKKAIPYDNLDDSQKKTLQILLYNEIPYIYDLKIKQLQDENLISSPLFNNLNEDIQGRIICDFQTEFESFYEKRIKKKPNLKGKTITKKQFNKYSQQLFQAEKNAFNDLNPKSASDAILALTVYWINEKLNPTLSVSEAFKEIRNKCYLQKLKIPSSSYDLNLEQEQKILDFTKILKMLFICPNTFNTITILQSLFDTMPNDYDPDLYKDYSSWCDNGLDALEYLNSIYYPLLETTFHLLISRIFTNLKAFEQFVQDINIEYFPSIIKNFADIDIESENTKKRNDMNCSIDYLLISFLQLFVDTEEDYCRSKIKRIDLPII